MKNTTFTISLLFFSISLIAQYGPQNLISSTVQGADGVYAADLNGDNWTDIIALSNQNFQILWFKNLDGQGNFGSEIVLSETSSSLLYFDTADLDSDGDLDIIFLENNPKRLIWKENVDGNGNFGPDQIIIENHPKHLISVELVDFNNNGFFDILVNLRHISTEYFVLYENLNGQGVFSESVVLIDDLSLPTYPEIVDLDNDGFQDIVLANNADVPVKIVWFKNLGNNIFDDEQLIYQIDFLSSDYTKVFNIKSVDINTDNKKDLVFMTQNDDTGYFVFWLENIDGQGNFGELTSFPNFYHDFYDLDNDGDQDMLLCQGPTNRIFWVENEDGLGSYGPTIVITNEVVNPRDVIAANIKENGHLEVISASFNDNKVAWYEFTQLGIESFDKTKVNIYPNPTSSYINIETSNLISGLILNDINGKSLDVSLIDNKIDLSNLQSGVYFLKVNFDSGSEVVKKIIKQ